MSDLDLEAAFACLRRQERETVEAFASTLGLDAWTDCLPLRRLVVAVAVQRLAADMHDGLSALAKLREAAWSLGAGHDGARLADAIAKALGRWQRERDKMSAEDAA